MIIVKISHFLWLSFMSLNLIVHVHAFVLARIFFQGSAAIPDNFIFLCPFLPKSPSLSALPNEGAHLFPRYISLKGLPILTSLTLAFTQLITALYWQSRIKPWGSVRDRVHSSSSTKQKWTGDYLCLLRNTVQKIGLKSHPSPVFECVTQGLGEAILPN